ncbi:hypothetical protein B7494_g3582 [Chlorociboria aeruginascens]|nr:hypothetical protein B7494_g3582 [Chlorociboria aeruginascens]
MCGDVAGTGRNRSGSRAFELREKRELLLLRCGSTSKTAQLRRVSYPQDRPPRWARRFERHPNSAVASNAPALQDKLMDRLQNLEALVKELSSRQNRDVEQQTTTDVSPAANTSSVQNQFGRLVLQDTNHSRYVSSGFWSLVNDEIDGLKMDLAGDESDSLDDEALPEEMPFAVESKRTPSERHAFLFKHNLSPLTPNLRQFCPASSEIPLLLDLFSANVNCLVQVVHIPTVTKMIHGLYGDDIMSLEPSNQALIFSICYAAINSLEEEDVIDTFGSSKTDLSLKYRLGLEHALANADFLNVPNLVSVQAFTIFLLLLRLDGSPGFVWMMTGLLVRTAQYLGLQRDGDHFDHLSPFDIEIRRRVWWVVCMVDMRASEDQGTDTTIKSGTFDTKIPLNINDADIDPETKQTPIEHEGLTDMSFARINVRIYDIAEQMMVLSVKNSSASLEEQSRLLNEMYQKYEQGYFQYTTESNIAYFTVITIARLVMAKMTLIVFLPVLFSSPSENFSNEMRTRLLVSAIEVAEYNHALNSEKACQKWHWICRTYTHWHSIVYLMIEISRRPWSSVVERAWVALHSRWLIPTKISVDKNPRTWVPLRKLMVNARKHRDAELDRLRADPQAAARLEIEDQKIPSPSSSGPFVTGSCVDFFRNRWRQLVFITEASGDGTQASGSSSVGIADSSIHTNDRNQPTAKSISAYSPGNLSSNLTFESTYLGTSGQQASQTIERTDIRDPEPAIPTDAPNESAWPYNPFPTAPADWLEDSAMGHGFVPWPWVDADADPSSDIFYNFDVNSIDVNMNLDGEVNWYNWVESARGME